MRAVRAAAALLLIACGASPGAPPPRAEASRSAPERSHEHTEAVDLLAAWAALAGLGEAASGGELRAERFVYRQVHAGLHTSSEDHARALRICGDPELHVVEGGYDVELFVQTVEGPDTLAWGPRHLELRGPSGALRLASDHFEVLGTRGLEPTRPRPFSGAECDGPGPRGCAVLFVEGEPPRRLAYPAP